MVWELWKKNFERWESTTADYLEEMLQKPAVLYPSGKILEGVMKTKSAVDTAAKKWWGTWGLPTKSGQERALHRLNRLESRILDLEEQIRELDGNES